MIQNDIGTTGAHVIVIHVEGLTVRVTYTDVHRERAEFFRDMLHRYAVTWNGGRAGELADATEDASFTMFTGTYKAKNRAGLAAYLDFLGSRLVFLIDWNQARKQLRAFLRGPERAATLRWAAETEIGQRGFLELGGAAVINQAIEKVAGSAMHFGDRLCDVLGDEGAAKFVQFSFCAATEGLKEHQSARLIHDRVCAELRAHFSSEGELLMEIASEHAGLIFELACQVREGLRRIGAEDEGADYERLAKEGRRF